MRKRRMGLETGLEGVREPQIRLALATMLALIVTSGTTTERHGKAEDGKGVF